ncbi:helix-turn-helix domain-containing protein [Nocardia sp. NPDC050713]|uniref:TetR/AcrR family transcriptional regulator n=1 Tax=unclassified Nocardia TaxID=2637762 RepID=UPI0033BF6A56
MATSTRRYRSTLRQAKADETRAAVLAAAAELFVARGWAGTSMRDIAGRAGCAVETVYSSVGNKREILKMVLDVAVVGDDEPVPLLERPEFHAIAAGVVRERAAKLAGLLETVNRRSAALHRVLAQAAAADAELAVLAARDRANRWTSMRAGLEAVTGRPVTDAEADSLRAVLGGEVYLALTEESAWTPDKYRNWAADTVIRLLDLAEE